MMKNSLEQGNNASQNNLILKWNLAYVYEKLGEEKEGLTIRKELMQDEKYYFEAYKELYKYVNDNSNLSEDDRDKLIMDIEDAHGVAVKNLNPKAKYLKNQLKSELRDTLNFKREGEL